MTASDDFAEAGEEVTLTASLNETLGGEVEYRFYNGTSTTPFHTADGQGASYDVDVPLDPEATSGIGNSPGQHRFRAEATISREDCPDQTVTGPGDGALDGENPERNEADVTWAMVNLTADLNNNGQPDNADEEDEDEYEEDTEGAVLFESTTAPEADSPDSGASIRLWTTWAPSVKSDEVALEVADEEVVQLWSQAGDATWSKESSPLTWPGDGGPPDDLWIEGLETGETMLTLSYEYDGQSTDIEDEVKVTVGDLRVEWEEIDSPLDNNPAPGGGKRIFPGKQDPSDTTDRNLVKVKVTTHPDMSDEEYDIQHIQRDALERWHSVLHHLGEGDSKQAEEIKKRLEGERDEPTLEPDGRLDDRAREAMAGQAHFQQIVDELHADGYDPRALREQAPEAWAELRQIEDELTTRWTRDGEITTGEYFRRTAEAMDRLVREHLAPMPEDQLREQIERRRASREQRAQEAREERERWRRANPEAWEQKREEIGRLLQEQAERHEREAERRRRDANGEEEEGGGDGNQR